MMAGSHNALLEKPGPDYFLCWWEKYYASV